MARVNLWRKRKQAPKDPTRSLVFRYERAFRRRQARADAKAQARELSGHEAAMAMAKSRAAVGFLARTESRRWHFVGDVSGEVQTQQRWRHGRFERRLVKVKG